MIQVKVKRIVDRQGRVVLPKSVRKKLDIQPEDHVVVIAKQDEIVIEKHVDQVDEQQMCYVTGITSAECHPFSGGIDLSKEAALMLLHELKSKKQTIGV